MYSSKDQYDGGVDRQTVIAALKEKQQEVDRAIKPMPNPQDMVNARIYNEAVAAHNKLLLKYNLSKSEIVRAALKIRLDASEMQVLALKAKLHPETTFKNTKSITDATGQ